MVLPGRGLTGQLKHVVSSPWQDGWWSRVQAMDGSILPSAALDLVRISRAHGVLTQSYRREEEGKQLRQPPQSL